VTSVVERIEALAAEAGDAAAGDATGAGAVTGAVAAGTLLLRGRTPIGEILVGERIAGPALAATLQRLGAARAVVLTEPVAWGATGGAIERALGSAGLAVELIDLPTGEAAKRLAVVEAVSRELARRRVERDDVLVAVGGGALGDTAGFVAATWLRGVRLVHVPTTLLAQVDSSIGGKTGVDLPEGKNLVGAFHQPEAVIVDVDLLRSLPERELRAALGEVAKMAVLGDERLLELLERDGERIAVGAVDAFASGAVAEAVERAAWAKIEVVTADERERAGVAGSTAGRITLNLGHSLGHAVEAAGGYESLRHGEAVGYGLRAAVGIGRALGVTPAARGERILGLLARLGLGQGTLGATDGGPGLDPAAIREALGTDKKHAGGRLRWVLPTETGVVVRDDVPSELVEAAIAELLAPAPRPASGAAR
jgi:3-dehydroquinate synthetase